ncbi:MAG: hypothetical protein C0503_10550 [Gemmatimonas sp.]|nr:hypothetical protein [Gemmatimonas sp.]
MIRLSASDEQAVARVTRLLTSPFDAASVDEWRRRVNDELKAALGAEQAAFMLPLAGHALLYSEELDPDIAAKYPDLQPPDLRDGRSIWQAALEQRVVTCRTIYGREYGNYERSPYYQEYAAPNRCNDVVAALGSLGGATPHLLAGVQLWRDNSSRRRFGRRELTMLRRIEPALRTAVAMQVRFVEHRRSVVGVLDALGERAMLMDAGGRTLHCTPAMAAELSREPAALLLREAIRSLTGPAPHSRVPAIAVGDWRLRRCEVPPPTSTTPALTLLVLERRRAERLSAESLRKKYGLTVSESRVALLLADGASNNQVAAALGSRPATARRHTEKVLAKMRISRRAEVAGRVLRWD